MLFSLICGDLNHTNNLLVAKALKRVLNTELAYLSPFSSLYLVDKIPFEHSYNLVRNPN